MTDDCRDSFMHHSTFSVELDIWTANFNWKSNYCELYCLFFVANITWSGRLVNSTILIYIHLTETRKLKKWSKLGLCLISKFKNFSLSNATTPEEWAARSTEKCINYRKQVSIVIYYGQHAVPREKTPIAKKPAHNYCSIFSLWMPKNWN